MCRKDKREYKHTLSTVIETTDTDTDKTVNQMKGTLFKVRDLK